MKRTTRFFIASLSFALVFFLVSSTWAQIDVGNFTISGEVEVGGLPRHKNGNAAKFEEYRDIPESVIVPQLQLMIGGKKEDFYLDFDSTKPGQDDQNYRLRFGRYGLIDVEFEWDQILHNFNLDTARTPYYMKGGNYTLANRPTAVDAATFRTWIEDNASPVDLRLLDKNAKIKIRYTPSPGWSFTGSYWSQKNDGGRAFGTVFGGTSSSAVNVAELVEPIDYQTHNIELGGEYAGNGWSLGLKYNGSLFRNSISTLTWDNPDRAVGAGACTDSATWNSATGAGSCRGRLDLYPSNQAHTFTLSGTARLPLKTQFLGTVSYGWRRQDDTFLPFTINSCYGSGVVPASCSDAVLTAMPTLSRGSLNADVRPAMINLSLVNNSVDRLNLKAYYRFYDLENRTRKVTNDNVVLNDNTLSPEWDMSEPYQYSKNNVGLEAGYHFTRWLTGKLNYGWERMHRGNFYPDEPHVLQSDEIRIGPTVDIKPNSWLLFRAAYRRSWRSAPDYFSLTGTVAQNQRKMFFQAKRDENKASLFADVTPWETLSFHGGFEFTGDTYPSTKFGVQDSFNYSPSIGAIYAPLEWLKLFADYNWDRVDWMQSSNSSTGFRSRGQDRVNTFSLGSDMDLVKNLLGFRIQYGFSQGFSRTRNSGASSVDWPNLTNTWQDLLARLEYRVNKNVGLQFGYYFNHYNSKDFGVDIMRVWMGDYDNSQGQIRSIYLGDRFKGPYTAQVGFVSLRLSF